MKNLLQQLKALWTQSSVAQRSVLLGGGALIAALIVGVGFWSSRPQYITLAANLSPSAAAELAARLDAQNVSYKMSFSGASLLVSKQDYGKARLAGGDLIGAAGGSLPAIDGSIISDPSLNDYRIQRRLEESLAQTVMQFESVASATVHVGRPPESPFITEQQDVTASVVVQLRPGASFTRRNGAAIVATVSRAVEGLRPQNVTVMDTKGRILSDDASAPTADIAGQLEYRQRVEADLSASAEQMLSRLLGRGHAMVRVSAEIDFTRLQRTETIYDPDGKVRTMERIMTNESKGIDKPADGVAGAASNIQPRRAGRESLQTTTKEETIESMYQTANTTDVVTQAAGGIKRLTVAAVVDLSQLSSQESGKQGANDAVDKKQIEAIIQQAVGFDSQRNDQISVVVSQLAESPLPPLAAPDTWRKYEWLIRNASLGVAALVALLLGGLALRKIQTPPLPQTEQAEPSLDIRRARALTRMSAAAQHNPDEMKDVLQMWLSQGGDELRRSA